MATEPGTDTGTAPEPATLLVVDDDEMNRDMLSRRLGRKGYAVAVAPDGRTALEMVGRSDVIDLVILDVMMPGLNGMEVLQELRQQRSPTDLPVIMATAKDQSEDIVRALELGANDYVTKPLDFPVVLARIRTQLALKRAVDEVVSLKGRLAERNRALEAANGRMQKDLRAAARIQDACLPRARPELPGAAVGWAFRPCEELAGDALNVFPLAAGRLGLYVLDVSGHGVASALLSVTLARVLAPPPEPSSLLVDSAGGPASPAAVADELNRRFPFDEATEQYFTLLYGILDVGSGAFRYVCAGHPGPAVVPAGGAPRVVEVRGFPVGLADEPYEEHALVLGPGDRLVLYSDGIPEAMGAERAVFGEARLRDALARRRAEPPGAMLAGLVEDVVGWCGAAGPRDDISAVAVECLPREAGAGGPS